MPVNYQRPEVLKELHKWQLIRDCVEGERSIKHRKEAYLPRPNREDVSNENKIRYEDYLRRAVFYNVTKRTLDGLLGQVFRISPVVEIPNAMDVLKEDIDGAGVALDQQAKRSVSSVLSYGRSGLLVDYPPVEGPTTQEQQQQGFVRPIVTQYEPWQIINWRTIIVGAKRVLSLVVLEEPFPYYDDGFEVRMLDQWRVLRLDPSTLTYFVEIHRQASPNKSSSLGFEIVQRYEPKGGDGKGLKFIPFQFMGSMNNDEYVDSAPMYDLATLNIGHYRNSADYEEACFLVGQPTPYVSGVTQNWAEQVLKGKIQLGSRAVIPLPAGGAAGLLQAAPNSMPKEAMEAKERQMVALGAKLVETTTVQRTLGEAQLEEASETSILSTVATNVSRAYVAALQWCAMFANVADTVDYKLSTDYPSNRLTPQERTALLAEWQGGAIAFSEMREKLRQAGVATLDDEEAKSEIETNPPQGVPGLNDPNADPNADPNP
jgi:hypothetical protein